MCKNITTKLLYFYPLLNYQTMPEFQILCFKCGSCIVYSSPHLHMKSLFIFASINLILCSVWQRPKLYWPYFHIIRLIVIQCLINLIKLDVILINNRESSEHKRIIDKCGHLSIWHTLVIYNLFTDLNERPLSARSSSSQCGQLTAPGHWLNFCWVVIMQWTPN